MHVFGDGEGPAPVPRRDTGGSDEAYDTRETSEVGTGLAPDEQVTFAWSQLYTELWMVRSKTAVERGLKCKADCRGPAIPS